MDGKGTKTLQTSQGDQASSGYIWIPQKSQNLQVFKPNLKGNQFAVSKMLPFHGQLSQLGAPQAPHFC